MTHINRVVAYTRQTGSRSFTPAQRRRIDHKLGARVARQTRAIEAARAHLAQLRTREDQIMGAQRA